MKYILLTGFLVATIWSFAQDNEFHLDETYPIAKGKTIHLKTNDAKIYIKGSDRDDVHLKIDRTYSVKGLSWGDRAFDVEVEEKDGDLYILEEQEGSVTMIGYSKEKYEIWIEAPAWANLDIKGDDDDYYINNLNGDISMRVDDGDITLENCRGRFFEFELDDGDLNMDGGNGSLKIDSDDGDVNIKSGSFDQIEADVDDGSVIIETSLSDNGDYNFIGDDSRFMIVVLGGGGLFEIKHDDASIRTSEVFEVVEENERKTVIKLSQGNARINIRSDDGQIRLGTL